MYTLSVRFSLPFLNSETPKPNENLRRKENITQQDLLEERLRQQRLKRDPNHYWHEVKIRDKVQKWNYRSEYVKRLGLDKNHSRIWLSFGAIIILGMGGFVAVKTQVIKNRREQMKERERMRKMSPAGNDNTVIPS